MTILAFGKNDRRLKLLWIDDKPSENMPQEAELRRDWGRIFAIDQCTSPEEVERLLPRGREDTRVGRRSPEYSLSNMPFDVILADFKMDEPRGGNPSPAARAPAAGLSIAVLAAMQFPEHPVAIIPYSAYSEQYGYQYELLKLICPPSMHVLWDESVHKGSINRGSLLQHSTREYRKAFQKGVLAGSVFVPFAEIDRWLTKVVSANDRGHDMVDGNETLTISTLWGKRSIGLDVLFSDVAVLSEDSAVRLVPLGEIKKWLEKIPPPPAEEREARALADLYWELGNSRFSYFRYQVAEALAIGETVPGVDRSERPIRQFQFPWIQHWKKTNDEEGYRPLRLAVLFLILREISLRTREHGVPVSGSTEQLARFLVMLAEKKELDKARAAILNYAAAIASQPDVDVEHELEEIRRALPHINIRAWSPVSFVDVLKLVDPLPDKWNAPVTWNEQDKVAKAFTDPTRWKPPLDIMAVLRGDGTCLSATEKACARRYAADCGLPRADWPAWLE